MQVKARLGDTIDLTECRAQFLQEAAQPFAIVVTQFCARIGHSGWPLLGLGCFIVVEEGTAAFIVLTGERLVACGWKSAVPLSRLMHGDSAADLFSRSTCVSLSAGCSLFVPFGSFVSATALTPIACMKVLPIIGPAWHKNVPENVKKATWAALKGYCVARKDKEPWLTVYRSLKDLLVFEPESEQVEQADGVQKIDGDEDENMQKGEAASAEGDSLEGATGTQA